MKLQDMLPVLLSILVIVAVAVLERHSSLIAAITATMPLNAPLALWVVHSANRGEQKAVAEFSGNMLVGAVPTLGFLVTVWVAARLGLKLGPMLAAGYGVWAVGLVAIAVLRRFAGL